MIGTIKCNILICLIEGQSEHDPTTGRGSSLVEPDIEGALGGSLEDIPGTSTQHPSDTHTYSPATTPIEDRGSNDSTPDQDLVIEIASKCV